MGGLDQAGGSTIGAIGFVKATVHSVGDDVGNAPSVGAHHGASGRHRLKQHQTKGFRTRGEQESVAAGVGTGQFFASQITHESRGGALEVLLQLLTVRPITHKGEAGVG